MRFKGVRLEVKIYGKDKVIRLIRIKAFFMLA
jgi:hypothetical protein